jgi:excinuclease ABC subunit A
LHFEDIRKLLGVLDELVEAGNSVVVIEHNLDVIKTADWIIDLGPEGGPEGGEVVAVGTPEEIRKAKASHTGKCLVPLLKVPRPRKRLPGKAKKARAARG